MTKVVLDSSAVLALLRSEPGAREVEGAISDSLISVVNESEVISRLIGGGESPERAQTIAGSLPYKVAELDRRQAIRAATLWKRTKGRGLSLGDRCCLALAEAAGLPVLTADTVWRDLSIGVEIRLIAGRRARA